MVASSEERIATLAAQREAHEERHARFEDRIEEHIRSVDDRLNNFGVQLGRVETILSRNGINPNNHSVISWVKSSAPQLGGGAGIGVVIIKIAEMALGS